MRIPEHVDQEGERFRFLQADKKFKRATRAGFEGRAGTVRRRQVGAHAASPSIGIEKQVPSGEFDHFHKRIDDRLIARISEVSGNAEDPRGAARHRCGIEGRAKIPHCDEFVHDRIELNGPDIARSTTRGVQLIGGWASTIAPCINGLAGCQKRNPTVARCTIVHKSAQARVSGKISRL